MDGLSARPGPDERGPDHSLGSPELIPEIDLAVAQKGRRLNKSGVAMETGSKKFRPFVYMILAIGALVAIALAVLYGRLYEDIEQDSPETIPPSPHEELAPSPTSP